MRVAVYAPPPPSPPVRITSLTYGTNKPGVITNTVSNSDTLTDASNLNTERQGVEYVDMSNGWITTVIGWLIWAFIAGLNVYLIVMLGKGES
jgi:metal iron transporter